MSSAGKRFGSSNISAASSGRQSRKTRFKCSVLLWKQHKHTANNTQLFWQPRRLYLSSSETHLLKIFLCQQSSVRSRGPEQVQGGSGCGHSVGLPGVKNKSKPVSQTQMLTLNQFLRHTGAAVLCDNHTGNTTSATQLKTLPASFPNGNLHNWTSLSTGTLNVGQVCSRGHQEVGLALSFVSSVSLHLRRRVHDGCCYSWWASPSWWTPQAQWVCIWRPAGHITAPLTH